jgi:TetR/AcrR family transcriptional repressor of nem operon
MMHVILNVKLRLEKHGVGTSQAEKAASHERIVTAAAARIRRDGIGGVSVSELMHDAGLTHGGFYRHFGSRDELIADAVDAALADGSRRTDAVAAVGGLPGFIDAYLSAAHRDTPETGCAVAALPADVSRAGPRTRDAYGRQVRRYVELLAGLIPGVERESNRDDALLSLAALVGAVSMARAVSDPDLSDEILARTARALHRHLRESADTESASRPAR